MNITLQKQSILAVNKNVKCIKENILVKTGADAAMVDDKPISGSVVGFIYKYGPFIILSGIVIVGVVLVYKSLSAPTTTHAYLNRNYM